MSPRSPEPIQRLSDLADPETRALAEAGVGLTLEANLAHLRSIKDTELKWLELLSVASLAAAGYLLSSSNPIAGWGATAPAIGFFLVAAWIQYVLANERLSYYGLTRSVVRAQNLLGLYEVRFLAPRLANSAFPKGLGPDPTTNGTQPFSSFLHRQIYSALLLATVLGAATFRVHHRAPNFWILAGVLAVVDLAWLVYLVHRDRIKLTGAWTGERHLAGADPSWFGAAPVPVPVPDEPDEPIVARADLAALGERLRGQGRRVVATNGHFDLLHVGHVRCLEFARAQGDCLVVAVNDDAMTRARKGPGRPIVPAAERAALLASLACVDHVVVFGEETAEAVVRELRPDVYVKGGDYAATADDEARGAAPLPERVVVEGYGGRVAIFSLVPDRSTTDIETRIRTAHTEGQRST